MFADAPTMVRLPPRHAPSASAHHIGSAVSPDWASCWTIGIAALIAAPHLIVDDRRLVGIWLRRVKGAVEPDAMLLMLVDQSVHLLCLLGAALLATG